MLLHGLGLEESLRALAVGLLSPETQVTASFSTHVPRLEQGAEVAVYRITRGAHERDPPRDARTIALTLETTDRALALEVQDDGCGFDPKHRRGSAGLLSMEERALALGGRLEVQSTPGRGTVIRLGRYSQRSKREPTATSVGRPVRTINRSPRAVATRSGAGSTSRRSGCPRRAPLRVPRAVELEVRELVDRGAEAEREAGELAGGAPRVRGPARGTPRVAIGLPRRAAGRAPNATGRAE